MYGLHYESIDSHRFLEAADLYLDTGEFLKHRRWYKGYILFLSLVKYLELPLIAISLLQASLGFVALLCFYKLSSDILKDKAKGFTACLLFLGLLKTVFWHFYLMSESVFVSATIIAAYLLWKTREVPSLYIRVALQILIASIPFFIRPNGLAFFIAFLLYLMIHTYQVSKRPVLRYLPFILLFIFVFTLGDSLLSNFFLLDNYRSGSIIHGVRKGQSAVFDWVSVRPPTSFTVKEYSSNWLTLIGFIAMHPIYFVKLFFGKIGWLLLHFRPFWSLPHILFCVGTLYPLYVASFFGIKTINRAVKVFCLLYVGVYAALIGMTTTDWNGRFLFALYPVFCLLAASPIYMLLSRLLKR